MAARTMVTNTTILSNRGYSLLKSDLTFSTYRRLKQELTVKPQSHPNYPDSHPFPAYEESDRWIRMPRFFGVNKFGKPRVDTFIHGVPVENETNLQFAGQLWTAQQIPHDKLLDHLRTEGSGLLCLHTAGGKTVITLSLAAHLKQKTCVLVHKSQLLQQWKERIVQFLPNARVSVIQGKDKDFAQDSDIYIIMIQTLLNVDTVPTGTFGFTIIDECHHLPSETFSRVLFKVNARYMLGLSATPERKDGLTHLLNWHLGQIVYQEKPDRSGQKTTQVDFYRFDSRHLKLDVKKYSQSITKLTECDQRNDFLVNMIVDIFKQDTGQKRRLLVLTDRVNHAEFLWETLCDLKRKLGCRDCGLLVAGMSQKTFKVETSKEIIVSTYGLMLEGIDIPELNGILLATPRRSVAQAIGRILRKVHTSIHPLIADVSDSDLRGQERARLSTYKTELGGNIEVKYHKHEDFMAHQQTQACIKLQRWAREWMSRPTYKWS